MSFLKNFKNLKKRHFTIVEELKVVKNRNRNSTKIMKIIMAFSQFMAGIWQNTASQLAFSWIVYNWQKWSKKRQKSQNIKSNFAIKQKERTSQVVESNQQSIKIFYETDYWREMIGLTRNKPKYGLTNTC